MAIHDPCFQVSHGSYTFVRHRKFPTRITYNKMDEQNGEYSVVPSTTLNDSSLEKLVDDSGAPSILEDAKKAGKKGADNSCNQMDDGDEAGSQQHSEEWQLAPKEEANDGKLIDDADTAGNVGRTEPNVLATYLVCAANKGDSMADDGVWSGESSTLRSALRQYIDAKTLLASDAQMSEGAKQCMDSGGESIKNMTCTEANTCVLELLLHSIDVISNRCNKLEARCEMLETEGKALAKRCREKDTACQQQEAPTNEGAVTLKPAPHKRMKTPPPEDPEFAVPFFQPWFTSAGQCHGCKHRWSVANRSENFPMDKGSWETIMGKMYINWTWKDAKCKAQDSYVNIATSLTQSLWAGKVIGEEEVTKVDTRIRTKLFQPYLSNHDKPLFVYYGGGKEKWVVVGCIKCQRATTIWYKEENARQNFLYYFPDPAQK